MYSPIQIVARVPNDCSPIELDDFMALVLAGGEVSKEGLEGRVRSAASLVFLGLGCCLSGVAALKSPEPHYRKDVSRKSGIELSEADFPYELGWVFVMPHARGRGFSADLTRMALSCAPEAGVFATSRADNAAMHATLAKFGFAEAGRTWPSTRGDYNLKLFIRRAAHNRNPDIRA
jgi:GNAT superfamily N-acetyltransferase